MQGISRNGAIKVIDEFGLHGEIEAKQGLEQKEDVHEDGVNPGDKDRGRVKHRQEISEHTAYQAGSDKAQDVMIPLRENGAEDMAEHNALEIDDEIDGIDKLEKHQNEPPRKREKSSMNSFLRFRLI